MKGAVRDRYGSPDVVRVEELDKPATAEGEVLVRTRAASVNRADLDYLQPRPGFIRLYMGLRAPRQRQIGFDVAGVVEAVGAGVTRFRPGDEVFTDLFASNSTGAFAEYVASPEKGWQPIAPGMSFEDAATLGHSSVLALQGLRTRRGREVKAGDRVLVSGASGNVGPFAVQIAKAMGAEVTGICSTDKVDFVRSLGADEVLSYQQVNFTRLGRQWDWILDTDSHYSIFAVRRALRPGGVYVTLGGTGRAILGGIVGAPLLGRLTGRQMGLMLWWKPMHTPDVDRIKKLIASGAVRPVIDRRFALDQIVDALKWVNDGHARGKVVITFEA